MPADKPAEKETSAEDLVEEVSEDISEEEKNDVLQEEPEKNADEIDTQPSSIADRRKLYENRSQSLIDEKRKSPTMITRRESFKENEDQKAESKNGHSNNGLKAAVSSKRTSTVFGKVSKFRHLKGTHGHRSTQIENIRNISRQISGECDGFHGNSNDTFD